MKKVAITLLLITLISCSTSNEIDESIETIETIQESTVTTLEAEDNTPNESTTTSVIESFNFDKEKMSPFTGVELPPELWLKRPRRVLAFKIDNNINSRPQSGIQEADAVFEILVEGGMTRFLAFFYDKVSTYLGPCLLYTSPSPRD